MNWPKRKNRAYVRLLPEDKVPSNLHGQWRAAIRELAANGIYSVDKHELEAEELYLGMSYHATELFEVL